MPNVPDRAPSLGELKDKVRPPKRVITFGTRQAPTYEESKTPSDSIVKVLKP